MKNESRIKSLFVWDKICWFVLACTIFLLGWALNDWKRGVHECYPHQHLGSIALMLGLVSIYLPSCLKSIGLLGNRLRWTFFVCSSLCALVSVAIISSHY